MINFYALKVSPSVYILLCICILCFGFQQEKTNSNSFERSNTKLSVEQLLDNAKYQQALELLEITKEQYKQSKDWEAYIACGVKQSAIADNLNDSIKKVYAQHTLTIAETVLDINSLQLGRAYQQMAEVNVLYQQYDSSLHFLTKALPVFKHHKEWETYAWALITKGISHYYLNEITLLKEQLFKAQQVYKKYHLNEEVYVTTLDLFSYAYELEGDAYRAIENNKQTIQFYKDKEQKNKTDTFFIANNYRALGHTYYNIGAYDLAINYLFEAITYNNELQQTKWKAECYFSISKMYENREEYNRSIQYLKKGIELIEKTPDNRSLKTLPYLQMSSSYWFLEKMDSSTIFLNKALETASDDNISFVELEYSNLLLLKNKSKEVIQLLNKTKKQLKANEKYYYASLHRNLGTAYGQEEDFNHAMFHFQKSLTCHDNSFTDTLDYFANPNLNQIKYPALFLTNLEAKAHYLSQFNDSQEKLEAALATYELSFQWMDTLLQSYSYDESRLVNNKKNRQYFERAIKVANQLYSKTKDKKYVDKAFFFAEKMKSNLLLATLQGNENQSIIPKNLKLKEKELAANVSYCELQIKEAKEEKNEEKTKLYQNYKRDYQRNLAEFKDSLKNDFPKYYDLKYSQQLATIPSIQNKAKEATGVYLLFCRR